MRPESPDKKMMKDVFSGFDILMGDIAFLKTVNGDKGASLRPSIGLDRGFEVILAHPELIAAIDVKPALGNSGGKSAEITVDDKGTYRAATRIGKDGRTNVKKTTSKIASMLNSATGHAGAMIYDSDPTGADPDAGKELAGQANSFAFMVDKIRGGIIASILNGGKVEPGQTPDNDIGAIESFKEKADRLERTVMDNYSDSNETIAKRTGISIERVNEIMSASRTAFNIPENAKGYSYAARLIPWLYYLVDNYGTIAKNTNADRYNEYVFNIKDDDSARGTANGSLYDFGKLGEVIKSVLEPESVKVLGQDMVKYVSSKLNVEPNADGAIEAGGAVATWETLALMLFVSPKLEGNKKLQSVVDGLVSYIRESEGDAAAESHAEMYKSALKWMSMYKDTFASIFGKAGADRNLLYKNIVGAVRAQIGALGATAKSGNAKYLYNDLTAHKKMDGELGRGIARALGYGSTDDVYMGAVVPAFLSRLAGDEILQAGMRDISSADVGTGDYSDAGERLYDSFNTAMDYGTPEKGTKRHTRAVTDGNFVEIPFDKVGSRLNASVAPERIVILFATELRRMHGDNSAYTQLYNELLPRVMHYIISVSSPDAIKRSDLYADMGKAISADADDLREAVDDALESLSLNTAAAIRARSAWIDRIEGATGAQPINYADNDFIRHMVDSKCGNLEYDEKSAIVTEVVEYIADEILYVMNRDVPVNNPNVPGGEIRRASWYNGVNRASGGNILRRSGTGDGSVTREGIYAATQYGATVVDDTDASCDIKFNDSSEPISVRSEEEAHNYVSDKLITINADGRYYAAWCGLVPYASYEHGVLSTSRVTGEDVKDLHAKALDNYVSNRLDEESDYLERDDVAGVNTNLEKIADTIAGEVDDYDWYDEVPDNEAGRESVREAAIGMFDDIGHRIGHDAVRLSDTIRRIDMNIGKLTNEPELKDTVNDAIAGKDVLPGLTSGELREALAEVARTNGDTRIDDIVKDLDSLVTYPTFKELGKYVAEHTADTYEKIMMERMGLYDIVGMLELLSKKRIVDAHQDVLSGKVPAAQGDPSLNERTPVNSDALVSLDSEEVDAIEADSSATPGNEPTGEISEFCDEHGLYDVPVDAADYRGVFGDTYPMLSLVKHGQGMTSHETLQSGDTLCGTGLNVGDLRTLVGGIESAHDIVSEISDRYDNGNPSLSVALFTDNKFITYLLDLFYPIFSAQPSARMGLTPRHEHRWRSLINQQMGIFGARVNDCVNPVLGGYAIECYEVIQEILQNDDLGDVVTGLANVAVYLESINPDNITQGVMSGSVDLRDKQIPAGAEQMAKTIGTKYSDAQRASKNLRGIRSDFRKQQMGVYSGAPSVSAQIAELYHIVDRGKTEGFSNQYDPFSYMLDKLSEKAVGGKVNIHGAIAKTDLMGQVVSNIIDDERDPVVGDVPYRNVAGLLKALSKGEPVDSYYLLTEEPKRENESKNGPVDVSSTKQVKFNQSGAVSAKGYSFTTAGDVAAACGVSIQSPDRPIIVDDAVDESVVTDIVTAVRTAIVEKLIKVLGERNPVDPDIREHMLAGARDIKGSDGNGYVLLAWLMMQLDTGSIDKARYAYVRNASGEMIRDKNLGLQAQMDYQLGSIDPSLLRAGKFSDTASIEQVIDILADYGMASLGGNADTMGEIKENPETSRLLGGYSDDFIDGFDGYMRRTAHINNADAADVEQRLRVAASKYLSNALRSDPSIANSIRTDDNVPVLRALAARLAAYREAVGPSVDTVQKNDGAKGTEILDAIRDMMATKQLADTTVNGFLAITSGESNADRLHNIASDYVVKLAATDPNFRKSVLKSSNKRDTMVAMQGVTPLDKSTRNITGDRATAVAAILCKDEPTEADKTLASDYGIKKLSFNKFGTGWSPIGKNLDELCSMVDTYVRQRDEIKSVLDNASTDIGEDRRKMITARLEKLDKAKGPESEARSKMVEQVRNSIAAVFNKDNATKYCGFSNSSSYFTKANECVDELVAHISSGESTDTRARLIQRIKSVIALAYASCGSFYRPEATRHMLHLAKNTTMTNMATDPDTGKKVSAEGCINIIKALSIIEPDSFSTHATNPGSAEAMYSLFDTLRTRAETVAIVNAALVDYYSEGNTSIDTDNIVADCHVPTDARSLRKLVGYIKNHSSMRTGTEVSAEDVAPFVCAMLVRTKCLHRTVDGFARTVTVNGNKFECTLPVSEIISVVDSSMPTLNMNSNEWQATRNEYSKYTHSAVTGIVGNREQDDLLKRFVAFTNYVKNALVKRCTDTVKNMVADKRDSIDSPNGISVRPVGANAVDDAERADITVNRQQPDNGALPAPTDATADDED